MLAARRPARQPSARRSSCARRSPPAPFAVCALAADLLCSLECVRADILQASTAHRRKTWCARPQRQHTTRLPRWTCSPAAHRALVCLALGTCLRWHPSHPLFACAFGSDDAESDKPHGNGSAGPHARAPRRHLARSPRHGSSARSLGPWWSRRAARRGARGGADGQVRPRRLTALGGDIALIGRGLLEALLVLRPLGERVALHVHLGNVSLAMLAGVMHVAGVARALRRS